MSDDPSIQTIMQGSPPRHIVPRADWDRPPWNRWSFQHIREILPTAEVWRGRGPVQPLPRAEQDFDTLPVTSVAGTATTLSQLLDETYTDGFLVLHKGKLVYERYFTGMTDRTLHLSQSVAKSFTGALAGALAGQGVIDPSHLVTHYVPELAASAYAGATLQQVLDMRSGVVYDETYTNPYSDVGQTDVASGWKPVPADTDPNFRWPSHVFELALNLTRKEREHGAGFFYRSIETDVAAFCMERATGKRLPQLLSEEIWQKLGMEESGSFTVDPAGYALADGGLNATLRDYARLGQLYLEGGRGIVPESWIEATRNGQHWHDPTVSLPEGSYRNFWWIEDAEHRSIMARGVFGQMIFVNWRYQTVVVKLSTWPDFVNVPLSVAAFKAANEIGRVLNS